MKGAGAPGQLFWWVLGTLMIIAMLMGLWRAIRPLGPWARPALVLIALSPAFVMMIQTVGHNDMFMLAGSLLVVLARRRPLIVLGAILAALGNPEHALISALCLTLVSFAVDRDRLRWRTAAYLGVSAVIFIGVQVWQRVEGSSGSRLQRLLDLSGTTLPSVRAFLDGWPIAIYSWLGPLWIVVVLILWSLRERRAMLAALAVIIIPGLCTIVTLDGTRVFVSIGLAALVALIAGTFRLQWSGRPPTARLLGAMLAALVVFPAIFVVAHDQRYVRLPYHETITFLFGD